MDRVTFGRLSDMDKRILVQITEHRRRWADAHRSISLQHMQRSGISISKDGDALDTKVTRGLNDPQSDLTAIGHKKSFQLYIPLV